MHDPILIFGLLLASSAALAIFLRLARQPALIAFVVVGIVAGSLKEYLHLPHETLEVFVEIGIILLLFMAGLETSFASLRKYWKDVLSTGFGQILLTALLAAALGRLAFGFKNAPLLVFFALCLTFSSTIIVLDLLRARRELESYHGQIILGLMVLQDIVAVLSLSVLQSLERQAPFLDAVGVILAKLAVLVVTLALLARWALQPLFRYLARSQDLLFLGSLGWALGVAAACRAFNFSAEIGAFAAGAALSTLPYKLEVQDKVEPIKDFGIILFFLTLGYGLDIGRPTLALLPGVILIALFVLVGTPLLIVAIGTAARNKSRHAVFIGLAVNQVSEFSLILAFLCKKAGIFDTKLFLMITAATLVTMVVSSVGHQRLDWIYKRSKPLLIFMDRRSREVEVGLEVEGHIVIVKYNEFAEMFVRHFLARDEEVVVIDIDPYIHKRLDRRHKRLTCLYADVFDPDVWEAAGLNRAQAIISCMEDGQAAELGILRWLKERGLDVPLLAATDSEKEASELYEAGALFVIHTDEMVAQQVGQILGEGEQWVETFKRHAEEYRAKYSSSPR